MQAKRKLKPELVRLLMAFSYLLILSFSALWLQSQFRSEKEELGKDITKLFTNVQERITDSLLLANYTAYTANELGQERAVADPAKKEEQIAALLPAANPVMKQNMRLLLQHLNPYSASREQELFRLDTIVFNEIFTARMRDNGWNFNAQWIRSEDSGKAAGKQIFIRSDFFTKNNGVAISNYDGYLMRRMIPQFVFVLILLAVTAAAFRAMYVSLQEQIKLGKMKDDFVSNMSHELKTPISTVKLALEALNNFDAIEQPELSREYLEMAALEMDRLELLVNSALNTSLLESGKLFINPESYDLEKLVNEVVQAYQIKLLQHNASITMETIGDHFRTGLDRLHTQGVIINILDNSLKYAQDNGPVRIHIRLREYPDHLQLSISDNGPGIPEEYHGKVFEKFFRVPNGDRHNIKGYGLGLSYAAQVMAQHQGSITVNNLPGGGCLFTLTF
jgi:signal transduction histidine kinase